MSSTLVRGGVAALAVALTALAGSALGIADPWPVVLALAVVLVPGGTTIGRVGAALVGAILGWVAIAVQAGFLPASSASTLLVSVGAVVLLVLVAVATAERLPLWAGLAGYAVFVGYYLPTFEASPTAFLSESPVAFVSVLLALGIGALAGVAADLLAPTDAPARPFTSGVAAASPEEAR